MGVMNVKAHETKNMKAQIEVLKESLELFIAKYNPKAMSCAITE